MFLKGEFFMKKSLIFLAIFIITFIAFFDAKDRFKELDAIASDTPSQVEMRQMINKPTEQMHKDGIQNQNSVQSLQQKMKQSNDGALKQNQLDNVDRRRNTINNQINSN